jgi:hypothetical protein
VHVDADVLDSVVNRAPQPPAYDARKIGYVNLVRLVHNESNGPEEEYDLEDDEEDYTKVNDMHAPLLYLGAESYNNLYDYFTWEYYVKYHGDEYGPLRR